MPHHTVKEGECLAGIAQRYGFLPEAIWNDEKNAALRSKRGDPDLLFPGDVLFVPKKELKQIPGATDKRHRFKKKELLGLVIRLDVDPADAATHEDRFVLTSTDHSYRDEKTVKHDHVPGDSYLDLYYSRLQRHKSYTLQVFTSDGGEPVTIFEDVPYPELAEVSGRVESEDVDQEIASPDEDAPYPEEPDEEQIEV